MADKFFGTLHTPLKPINYSPGSSDTIDIYIDQDKRIIYAQLKESIRSKIYAALNLVDEKINKLDETQTELLEVIRSELENLDIKLSETITSIEAKFDELAQNNSDEIKSEIEAATNYLKDDIEAANTSLQNKITDEINRLEPTLEDIATTAADQVLNSVKIIGGNVNPYAGENKVTIVGPEDEPKSLQIDIDLPEVDLSNYYDKPQIDEKLEQLQPSISWIVPSLSLLEEVEET